jgi:hypothetical protein
LIKIVKMVKNLPHFFKGMPIRIESGSVQFTSFLRTESTILSATYFGSSIGIIRGLTPANIPVAM